MKVIKKQNIFPVLFIFYSFLLVFCSLEPPFSEEEFASGRNYIRIKIGNLNNRTILPGTTIDDFLSYSLVFHTAGTTDNYLVVPLRLAAALSDPVYLDAGLYDLVLTAYTDASGAQPAARAAVPITIGSTPQTHTVTLTAIGTGSPVQNGLFEWKIEFPADFFDYGEARMEISKLANPNDVIHTFYFSDDSESSVNIASGSYRVTFFLKKDPSSLPVVWHEVLHIYQHMKSFYEHEFTDADFYDTAFRVYYHFNDGETEVLPVSYHYNDTIVKPANPARQTPSSQLFIGTSPVSSGYTFLGWFADSALSNQYVFGSNITADINLYAKWGSAFIDVSGRSENGDFEKAAGYVNANANPSGYTILVREDITTSPVTLNSNSRLVILGEGSDRKISLGENGVLLNIFGPAANEIILENITLVGRSIGGNGNQNNNSPVAAVQYGAKLIMRNNSKITGNRSASTTAAGGFGAAVYVTDSESVFQMDNSSSVTGNEAAGTGTNITAGLYAESGAQVILNNGSSITGNADKNIFLSHDSGGLTLSGTAAAGNIVLNAISAALHSTLTVASGWSGPAFNLSLRGNSGDTSTAAGFWVNSKVLDGTGFSAALSAGRIVLGDFISPNASAPISSPPYIINAAGELVYSNTSVTVQRGSGALTGFPDLTAALAAIITEGEYTVTISSDQSLAPVNINTSGIKITLKSADTLEKRITLSSNGSLFSVNGFNVELILEKDITLVGRSTGGNGNANNNNPVVTVQNAAVFTMLDGSMITGNTSNNSTSCGAAVYLTNSGVFRMKGGVITGNASTFVNGTASAAAGTYPAGGLYAVSNSAVYIEDGSITGNTGLSDVFINQTADIFSLAEEAEIGTLVMNYSNVNFTPVTIVSGWNGSVGKLSLRGANLNNSPATTIATVMSFWGNNKIFKGAVNTAVVLKFPLGEFIDSGGNTQPISNTHYFDDNSVLRAKNCFAFALPPFTSGSPVVTGSGAVLSQGANDIAEFVITNPDDYTSIKWYYGNNELTTTAGDKKEILNLVVSGVYDAVNRPYDLIGIHTVTVEVITKSGAFHTKDITFEVEL